MHTIRVTSDSATQARLVAKYVRPDHNHVPRDKTEQRAKKDGKRDFRMTIALCLYGVRAGAEL